MGSRRHPIRACLLLSLALALASRSGSTQTTQATTVPLLLPAGLAYDSSGDLLFAESANHVVRQVSPTGGLTTVAGTGIQGFAGDGGPATQAQLDSPAAIALDKNGNLYIADTHNHRVRRVDDATGTISTFAGTGRPGQCAGGTLAGACALDLPVALAFDATQNLYFADARTHLIRRIDHLSSAVTTVAGNGTQGFSGDNGPALAAALDSPYGLAIDAAGDLYLADTHNHRIRRVDAATGVITTVAGTGQPGLSGDSASAATTRLSLPRGLALDASGNLYLVDSANQRIRRVDSSTGAITTVAGTGMQGFSGDNAPAPLAELNLPRAVTFTPAGQPIFSDAGNGRVREITATADILTVAGLGSTPASVLTLSGPTVVLYGSGSVTATLTASPASGSVNFFESLPGGLTALGTGTLAANASSFSLATLPAATYRIEATYAGDATHAAAQSNLLSLSVAPAPAQATVASAATVYGQPIPALTGSLSGILAQDTNAVALSLTTAATPLSSPAAYPITATLTGSAAGNYTLSQTPAAITISKAPSTATLTQALATHVASTTSGTPTGTVTLLDGANPTGSATLSATGDASFSSSTLTAGSHTLTASYAGDANFLPAASTPVLVTVAPPASADFALAASGQTAQTIAKGSAATFTFMVTPLNGTLPGAIQLAVSGLPAGATASFTPAYLPPSGSATNVSLTIQTQQTAALHRPNPLTFALLLPLGLVLVRRRRRKAPLLTAALLLTGCSDRVFTNAKSAGAVAYNITVTATATSSTGSVLLHTAGVVLTTE